MAVCRDLTDTLRSAEEWAKQVVQFGHTDSSVQVLCVSLLLVQAVAVIVEQMHS